MSVHRRNGALAALMLLVLAFSGCRSGSAPPQAAAVDRDRLLADADPGQWLAGGRDWRGTYYSPLEQINVGTAHRVGLAWDVALDTARGLEATPVVVDGVMYTSGNWGRVYALDARSGRALWSFVPDIDGQYGRNACCDVVNRGVAVWRGRVYVGSTDGWLYALDAATGKVVWKQDTFFDRKRTLSISGAPQIAGDVVVIGQGGADFNNARGYVSAYDLATGKLRWRFFTVPGDPRRPAETPDVAAAAKTWARNSLWKTGGGGTAWDGMAYDPTLDLLYVGTGNSAPAAWQDRSPGGGDNLYLASILAIHPKTGRLAWHYQTVPGERWDYTATQKMILADLVIGGRKRQVLMQAPKNGFFYVLDRRTGQLISARAYAPMNWANGVDLKTGRPNFTGLAEYEHQPALVFPASSGAHNWQPMSYNPETGLVYIPTIEAANVVGKNYDPHGRTLLDRWNVNMVFVEDYPVDGWPDLNLPPLKTVLKGQTYPRRRAVLRAWDPVNGRVVWETPSPEFWEGGVMSTRGGLVVQGNTAGRLTFRDARNGKLMTSIDTGASIMAAPMSYVVDGVQYVAVMAGYGGGPGWVYPKGSAAYRYGNQGHIMAFRLDGRPMPARPVISYPPFPRPPERVGSAAEIAAGAHLFVANCARCHANAGPGLVPDLRRIPPEIHQAFDDIVLRGALSANGMGRFDDILDQRDVHNIHAYLIDQAWTAFDDQHAKGGGATKRMPTNAH